MKQKANAFTTAQHYDRFADDYERRWRGYLENTHGKLLEALAADLEENDSILDVSCGTGLLASQLLEREAPFREMVLNDISPRMLQVAQNRLTQDKRLSFTSFAAEELEFEDNRFTKIVCLNALHNYADPMAAAYHFRRTLTPEGRLYLLDWNRAGWFRPINALIRWSGEETINTRSLKETAALLREQHFSIKYTDGWRYGYWRLFLIVAGFCEHKHSDL